MGRKRNREPKWLQSARTGTWDRKPPGEKPDWLRRVLVRAGAVPPSEVESVVRAGRVRVAGQRVHEPMTLVRQDDEVLLDGRRVETRPPTLVIAFHKPAGAIVSSRDPRGAPTVFDRLNAVLSPELARYGWHAVGRLDKNTTGLLLFTNDERFAEYGTRPETHLPKRYVAEVPGRPEESDLEPLRKGIVLDDGPTRPARARVLGEGRVELTISEGRNHQVKRMLAAVGFPVRKLHREAIGELVLDVAEGDWRMLEQEEIREKLRFVGGSGAPRRSF